MVYIRNNFNGEKGNAMLKLLNVLGYISLISVIYYILVFLFSFDLTLQIINIVMVIAIILVNIFAIKKYLGIRILVSLIIIALLSSIIYVSYTYIKGNMFKEKIEAIYDEAGNKILDANEIKSYSVRYIPDKFYIDNMSKGYLEEGRIAFANLYYADVPITYTVTISSFGTYPEHYTIIINNKRYVFN